MRSTAQLRRLWAPPCEFTRRTLNLYSGATLAGLNAAVYEAFQALDATMKTYGYVPRANTRTSWETGAYNCRRITNGSGYSLHAYGIAADINARTNPYGPTLVTDMPRAMVAAAKAIRTKKRLQVFRWGGDYRTNKDAMHFEVVLSPAEVKAGIDWNTVPVEPPNAADPTTWPTIRRGERGPSVTRLVELLAEAGFGNTDTGPLFGAKTHKAVRSYQESRKLQIDGIVGLQTWTALINAFPEVSGDEPSRFKTDLQATPERPLLESGSRGSEVEELQRRLSDEGCDPGPIDGTFGRRTKAAVVAFQRANGLQPDGVCGPLTWRALLT